MSILTDTDLAQILAYAHKASPAPVSVIQLPPDRDPMEWIQDCLAKNIHTEVYGVAVGNAAEVAGGEALVTAITGNGPTSYAHACFYAMCHTAIPVLVAEVIQLRQRLGNAMAE